MSIQDKIDEIRRQKDGIRSDNKSTESVPLSERYSWLGRWPFSWIVGLLSFAKRRLDPLANRLWGGWYTLTLGLALGAIILLLASNVLFSGMTWLGIDFATAVSLVLLLSGISFFLFPQKIAEAFASEETEQKRWFPILTWGIWAVTFGVLSAAIYVLPLSRGVFIFSMIGVLVVGFGCALNRREVEGKKKLRLGWPTRPEGVVESAQYGISKTIFQRIIPGLAILVFFVPFVLTTQRGTEHGLIIEKIERHDSDDTYVVHTLLPVRPVTAEDYVAGTDRIDLDKVDTERGPLLDIEMEKLFGVFSIKDHVGEVDDYEHRLSRVWTVGIQFPDYGFLGDIIEIYPFEGGARSWRTIWLPGSMALVYGVGLVMLLASLAIGHVLFPKKDDSDEKATSVAS